MTREEMITDLIASDVDLIASTIFQDDTYITDILRYGMIGYEQLPEETLIRVYNNRFTE